MTWGFDDFAGVENEGFEICDFVFELNFLGFFVCLSLKKIFGDEPKEHEHVLQKKIMKEIKFFNLIILFYFKRI